jgi:hypothetical protein
MRRSILLASLFAIGLAAIGCKHTAGKCDCTYDPSNHPMPGISNPYPVAGPTMGSAAPAPETTAAPMQIPPVPMVK